MAEVAITLDAQLSALEKLMRLVGAQVGRDSANYLAELNKLGEEIANAPSQESLAKAMALVHVAARTIHAALLGIHSAGLVGAGVAPDEIEITADNVMALARIVERILEEDLQGGAGDDDSAGASDPNAAR